MSATYFAILVTFCAKLSLANQCALLPGDLELTKGCTTGVYWKDGTSPRRIRYVSVKCDGQFLKSLQQVLVYFERFNCSSPLHLQITKPSYSLEPPLFRRVAAQLYHLEILDLHPVLPGPPKSLEGLRALKILTLQFQDLSAGEIRLNKNLFLDNAKIEYLKIHARSVPLIIEPNTLKNFSHLQCLLLSGSNVTCDCTTLNFVRWIQDHKPSSIHGHYKDPVTHRVELCRIETAVCHNTNEPITNQEQFKLSNCSNSAG